MPVQNTTYEGRDIIIDDDAVDPEVVLILLHGGLGTPQTLYDAIHEDLPSNVLKVFISADATKLWKAGSAFGDDPADPLYISSVLYNVLLNHPTVLKAILVGHSNGAEMALRAANIIPYLFFGIVAIAGTHFESDFTYSNKILHIHGDQDTVIDIRGNTNAAETITHDPIIDKMATYAPGSEVRLLAGVPHNLPSILDAIDLSDILTKFVEE